MYDIFGNFDSVEEINACAEGLRQEGDLEQIKTLAKENGIMEFFVQQFVSGESSEFTGWMEAAMGKLEVEREGYKNNQIPVEPVLEYLLSLCAEEEFARAVRRRTKSVKECMKKIEKNCREIQRTTKKNYVADMVVFHWARDYFLEGETCKKES